MVPEPSDPSAKSADEAAPLAPQFRPTPQLPRRSFASRLPRLICSQNPFYLLSVCFVLHASAQWFHRDSGAGFSPWPLLALNAGYIALLATTGYVIVRFGRVWDDARSILLLILLLFVEMSLIFDETLVQDPSTGRPLLLAGLIFAMTLSELLLCGLKIRLPWLFRIPYHLFLSLLFLYPLVLAAPGLKLSAEAASWRIFLFPVAAAGVLLTLLPAIRRGPEYTRMNGTPWLWPWYPWSLFVFLSVCVGFRAYALSLSFDPVLGASLADALSFKTTFGVYFLVPLVLAAGVLLLEVGLTSNRRGAVWIAMQVPFLAVYLAMPALGASAPYEEFLRRLVHHVGSPVWLTIIAAVLFYAHALIRRVESAEILLTLTLMLATRIGPQTTDLSTLSILQVWPLVVLALLELMLGSARIDSLRVFVGLTIAIAAVHAVASSGHRFGPVVESGLPALLWLAAILLVGAIFRDEFAWLLRISGAPLIVMVTLAGVAGRISSADTIPFWGLPVFVVVLATTAFAYRIVVQMRLYQLSGLVSVAIGGLGIAVDATVLLIRDSSWKGAGSFAFGLGWFVLAVLISSWKAGWLQNLGPWLGRMMTVEPDGAPAM